MTRASTSDDREVRWQRWQHLVGLAIRVVVAEVATPGLIAKTLPGKGAAVETKGKSRRSADLKGRVVEEGEAKAGRARGDAMAVPVMRSGN
ncbi:hypothetical protein BHE74_00025193 [Ensete ventricosum]|nr:hypothetical protein BHE74_00025193 [Ensete ventricosum]